MGPGRKLREVAAEPDGALDQLQALRHRADEDYLHPAAERPPGRHQLDLAELGLRVAVTRARYPNRTDGVDQYAVTISRVQLDRPAAEDDVRTVLTLAFGASASQARERTTAVSLVRMFRVPAEVGVGAHQRHETARPE